MTTQEKLIILEFYERVCQRAERNMLKTNRLEGAHFAAMKAEIADMQAQSPDPNHMNRIPAQVRFAEGDGVVELDVSLEVSRGTCETPVRLSAFNSTQQIALTRPAARELVRQVLQQLNSTP